MLPPGGWGWRCGTVASGTTTGVWYYRKGVVNVANLHDGEAVLADLFLQPTLHVCSQMGLLR